MTFGQPLWFWAFSLLPIFIALFLRNEIQRIATLKKLVAVRLIDRLAGSVSEGKRRARFLLILLGLSCIVLSLTEPRYGFSYQERKSKGRDVIIAIDTSKSMLANDLAPNRLTRAKLAAEDLISQLAGDRVGLIAFAGSAFLQAPLTSDHGAVLGALHEIDTDIIPRGGTNIAEAIRTAVEAFGKGESDNRALVIFTDGEELDANGITAAKDQKQIAKIFTVGVGSTEGTVISIPGNRGAEYVTDPNGQIVKSRLDEERLRAIADASGGFYLHLQNGPAEMRQLVRDGLGFMSEKDISTDVARQPIERYQWPLGIGMVLLVGTMLMSERRRKRVNSRRDLASSLFAIAFVFGTPHGAYAESSGELYAEGKYADAQRGYEEQMKKTPGSDRLAFNHGAAAYKNRDFRSALESFGKALTTTDPKLRAQAEYNLGNTLFQQSVSGKKEPDIKGLESALSHFDQARQFAAIKDDAQYNYDATKQLIEQLRQKQDQPQQEQQKQDQKKDQDKDKKDDQKQDQQKHDQKDQKDQQQNGDQKDQQKQDQQSGDNQDKQDGKSGQKDQQKNEQGKQDEKQGENGEQKQDQKDGKSDQQKPDKQSGQEGEKSDDPKNSEQQNGQDNDQQEQPKKEGDLKNNAVPGQESKEAQEEKQAAEEARAAAEGRMTEAQAKSLLDSLKSEDARVQLLNPRDRHSRERPLRDW